MSVHQTIYSAALWYSPMAQRIISEH